MYCISSRTIIESFQNCVRSKFGHLKSNKTVGPDENERISLQ